MYKWESQKQRRKESKLTFLNNDLRSKQICRYLISQVHKNWIGSSIRLLFKCPWPELISTNPASPQLQLTHCRLNRLPHTIYWKSLISILGMSGYEIDIPREKWLNYLQTVETHIRRHVLWRLIWVCTVC